MNRSRLRTRHLKAESLCSIISNSFSSVLSATIPLKEPLVTHLRVLSNVSSRQIPLEKRLASHTTASSCCGHLSSHQVFFSKKHTCIRRESGPVANSSSLSSSGPLTLSSPLLHVWVYKGAVCSEKIRGKGLLVAIAPQAIDNDQCWP